MADGTPKNIHIRRPVPSTDQALPSCFYFRISRILMELFYCLSLKKVRGIFLIIKIRVKIVLKKNWKLKFFGVMKF